MKIHALPAFTDNIIWGLESAGSLVVVDPGQSAPVAQFLKAQGLRLSGILITHHHADHTGGIRELLALTPNGQDVPVFGPATCRDLGVSVGVSEAAEVRLFDGTLRLRVLECPGHTADHIAFYGEVPGEAPLLFCGDTLFAGGCGRLLGGTAEQLYASLDRLRDLPGPTRVFCAHEYTLNNLLFAADVLPAHAAIGDRLRAVQKQRAEGLLTLPSTIALERETNPFLLAVGSASLPQFVAWRLAKDTFRPQPTKHSP